MIGDGDTKVVETAVVDFEADAWWRDLPDIRDEDDPFIEHVMHVQNSQFLMNMSYGAVVFNYSGSFVNDSYVTWRASVLAMRDIGAHPEDEDTITYAAWRSSGCSTLDGFLFNACPWYASVDSGKWLSELRPRYHDAYHKHRLDLQKYITLAPGLDMFVDRLDMLGIPWYVKVSDDFQSKDDVVSELTLLCTFYYVAMRNLPSKILTVKSKTESRLDVERKGRVLDNRALNRLRHEISMEEHMKLMRRKMVMEKLRCEDVLWFVDNRLDCEIAHKMRMSVATTPWGSGDPRAILSEFHVSMVDPMHGYVSLVNMVI